MPKARNVAVDTKLCIGCALCTSIAPATFEMGADGKSHAKNPPKDGAEDVQRAVDGCPVKAISWKK
jgi:ferredoxin